MPRLVMRCLLAGLLGLMIAGNARAQTPAVRPGCAVDSSFHVCVTSAALTYNEDYDPGDNPVYVDVSVTLRITNTTDYPVGVGVLEGDFAFTPQNADSITARYSRALSGIQECNRAVDCEFTTIAPGRTALLQVRFGGAFGASGLPLMQIARTASFSASLFVNERGAARLVSVPLEGFAFGNGLTRGR